MGGRLVLTNQLSKLYSALFVNYKAHTGTQGWAYKGTDLGVLGYILFVVQAVQRGNCRISQQRIFRQMRALSNNSVSIIVLIFTGLYIARSKPLVAVVLRCLSRTLLGERQNIMDKA